MKGIGDFLSRYLGLRPPGAVLADALREVIVGELGVELPEDAIKISGTTAFIRAPSVLKSEIALRKENILRQVKQKAGDGLIEVR